MTTSTRETILASLHELLAEVDGYTVLRNAPLPDMDGTSVNLVDGETELVEEFINASIYEFTLSAALVIVVADADPAQRDALLDAAIVAFTAAVEDEDAAPLHENVTDLRVLPPTFAPREVWGGTDMKGAEVPIEIDYWGNSRSG